MYTRDYQDIVYFLENLSATSFIIAEKAYPIEKLHIQSLVREIDGKSITFLALRNIQIAKAERRKGIISFIVKKMKDSGLNIMFDDIVSEHLFDFLMRENFSSLFYEKMGYKIRAAYLIQETE